MKCAEIVVRILEREGILDAFGIPGASINPVYQYLAKSDITHHLMRHEEAAVHAADGYFRASGKLALAICTSGPGATNLVTGLYTAWVDSIPLIAITGQNMRSLMGKMAFQCVDIAEITRLVCKKTYCVMNPEDLLAIFNDAFRTAREGRKGPVLIDLPMDIQNADINFSIDDYEPAKIIKASPERDRFPEVVRMLDSASNPLIIMGGGVVAANAEQDLITFAEYMNIPVITTYMAKGAIPENHYLNAGLVGTQVGASSIGNQIFLESDVVLGIGCRFSDRHTGNLSIYRGNRKFIHIDIDPKEIGKIITPDIGIVSDAAIALLLLIEEATKSGGRRPGSGRVNNVKVLREKEKLSLSFDEKSIDPRAAFIQIGEAFKESVLYTTGCGLNQIWSGQYLGINKPRQYLPSGGAGTLGFDIPAAIGASIGTNKSKAVCIMGDFGFTFLVEELAVAAKEELPIIVIILNNECLSLIRQNQKYGYGYEYAVQMGENKGLIDYVGVAKSFGCQAERVFTHVEFREALSRASAAGKPYVIDAFVVDEVDCNMGNEINKINRFI